MLIRSHRDTYTPFLRSGEGQGSGSDPSDEVPEPLPEGLSRDDQDDLMAELAMDVVPLDDEDPNDPGTVATDGLDAAMAEPAKPAQEPVKDQKPAAAATQPAKPAASDPKPPAAQQTPWTESVEYKAMQQQMQQLTQQNQQLLGAMQVLRGGQAAPAEKKPAAEPAQIAFSVDDKVIEGLVADDPAVRKQAVHGLVQATLQTAMREFNLGAQQLMANDIPQMVSRVQENREWTKSLHDTFYGFYPKLGEKPRVKHAVSLATVEVVREMHKAGEHWDGRMTKNLANRIARKTLDSLGISVASKTAATARQQPAHLAAPATAARVTTNGGLDPNSPAGILDIIGD